MRSPAIARARLALESGALAVAKRLPQPLLDRVSRTRGKPGMQLDSQLAVMLALAELAGADVLADTPEKARQRLVDGARVADAPPPEDVEARDLSAQGPAGAIPLRLYEPSGLERPSAGLLYLHGGGWVAGSIESHDRLCRRLAGRARCRVVSVEYRLAPEHPYPAAVDDARAAFAWMGANADSLGLDPRRLGVGGDSAGGNLAAVVARHARTGAAEPVVQLLIYPATDATRSMPSHATFGEGYWLTRANIDWYLGHYTHGTGVDLRTPDLSPLYGEDVAGLCPALIYTAGFDPLCDEGRAYADRLKSAGTSVQYACFETLVHGFASMTAVSRAAMTAFERIADDLRHALEPK